MCYPGHIIYSKPAAGYGNYKIKALSWFPNEEFFLPFVQPLASVGSYASQRYNALFRWPKMIIK